MTLPRSGLVAVASLLCAPLAASWDEPNMKEVRRLSGWARPLIAPIYSGFFASPEEDGVKGDMHEHFLFFVSESKPKTDPVIMVGNPKVGVPGIITAFAGIGPYLLHDASVMTASYNRTQIPTLFENPDRWTKFASLLFRSYGPPVGYSHCDPAGPSGDSYSCGNWNNTKYVRHSLGFMEQWRLAFPDFANCDLFLSGSGFAGITSPELAHAIVTKGSVGLREQLRGIAVGNPCIGGDSPSQCLPRMGPLFTVEFLHGHGQFSTRTYEAIRARCSEQELLQGVRSYDCREALDQMQAEVGIVSPYNLYDECYEYPPTTNFAFSSQFFFGTPWRDKLDQDNKENALPDPEVGKGPGLRMDGYPCNGLRTTLAWIQHRRVKQNLGIAPEAAFFLGGFGTAPLPRSRPNMVPVYRKLLLSNALRVLVFNGDTEPSLNSLLAENWTKGMGFQELRGWRPWSLEGHRMGGYVTEYEHGFTFATVRGAGGSMAHRFKPTAVATLMHFYLQDRTLPDVEIIRSVSVLPPRNGSSELELSIAGNGGSGSLPTASQALEASLSSAIFP